MNERFSLAPLFKVHLDSFRDPQTWRLSRSVLGWYYIAPVVLGVAAGTAVALGMPVVNGLSQLLAASGLLVGAMLTTFVFLANLRLKVDETTSLAYRQRLQKLIGSTVASALYSAVMAMALTLALAMVATLSVLRAPEARPIVAAVLTAIIAHLGLSIVSVVRRMFGVYYSVFASDFTPVLRIAPQPVDPETKRRRRA